MLGQAGRLTRNSAASDKLNRASLAGGVATKTQQDLLLGRVSIYSNPIHPTIKVILVTTFQNSLKYFLGYLMQMSQTIFNIYHRLYIMTNQLYGFKLTCPSLL